VRQAMLHHVSLGAQDIERTARFYDAVLAPLGYVRVWSDLRPGEQGRVGPCRRWVHADV